MFTPAQTLITGTLTAEITNNPQAAFDAHVQDITVDCEQVVVLGYSRVAQEQIYMACSSTRATHTVDWVDELGHDTMEMCEAHKDEFIIDAEGSDTIKSYVVTEL
jgi:hypothetical protein